MQDKADQLMELQVFQDQGPNPNKLLLTYLKNRHYAAFKSLAMKGLKKSPPNIYIDYVYPHPIEKTVLDIASETGLEDFVELILKLGANPNKENIEHHGSPLHFAAQAGHKGVLKILLSHPAIKPNLEVGRQTALHLAVRNEKLECVEVLLENNASPNIANGMGLTPTHIAAMAGQEDMINLIFSKSKCPVDIDNFRDFNEKSTRQILERKMSHLSLPPVSDRAIDINDLKYYLHCNDEDAYLQHVDEVEISAEEMTDLLQVSARHNLLKVVKSLSKHENYIDESVLTHAASIAIEGGHHKVLAELLNAGAEPSGSLLIKACRQLGSNAHRGSDRTECVRLILLKPLNVRCVDGDGNTALHYAALAECSEIVSMLLKAGSYIGQENFLGIPPIASISPETMSKYLDDCLQTCKEHTDNYNDYEIEFNYQCLVPHGLNRDQDKECLLEKGCVDYTKICMEMQPFLHIANSSSHRHLLKHPILSSFLYLKWQCISPMLYANFIFYVLFYILLNAYILSMNYANDDSTEKTVNDSIVNATNSMLANWQQNVTLWTFTAIALVILVLREILQLVSSPWDYFFSSENLLELCLVILGVFLLGGAGPSVGAVAILLSAWELIILIGQHPRMSTAIEMFKTVTRNFLHFLFLYAFLILAFALSFFTLFKDGNGSSFPDPGHSLFKTIIMLTGEFDADKIPFPAHPILSHLVFILFVFLIVIVLFNLLNGLAVSDTAEILGKAELVGLISRAKLIAYAESIVIGSPILKKRWCCNYGRIVQRFSINPLRFLSKKILFFPDFLPEAKIRVKPLLSNTVIPLGRIEAKNVCTKLTLDKNTILQAKEIISARGRVSDYDRIVQVLNQKFERLEKLFNSIINVTATDSNYNNTESD